MRLKHRLRRMAHRFGIDIVRYPMHDPLARTAELIRRSSVTTVVDVGANDGEFAAEIRDLGFRGRLISFEPLNIPFGLLAARAKRDGNWDAIPIAIGAVDGLVEINVAANAGQSSSVLPMLPSHVDAAPEASYLGTQTAPIRRLDAVLPELGANGGLFVKIDVQGYEAAVLDGASELFGNGAIVGLQLEMSLEPLYEGSMMFEDALARVKNMGFQLMGIQPVFVDPASGRLLQVDGVFFRDHA